MQHDEPVTIQLRFVRQEHEAEGTQSFLFQPQAALEFVAGQYLRYTLPHADADSRGVARTFTIASAPAEPLIRLTTRVNAESSSFKRALAGLPPGAIIHARGPYGKFVVADSDSPAVLIAGGIGITPIRSILADLAARPPRPAVTLLYSNASPDFPFQTYFASLVADWPTLQVVYTVTRPSPAWTGPTGRIDRDFIHRYVPDPSSAVYFVCGPTALVEGIRTMLAEAGVEPARIKFEGFPGYDARPRSGGGAMPSFASDIRPLFRDSDVDEMRFMFDLSQYEEVKSNAAAIVSTLDAGSMPCDTPWPKEQVALFRQWMDGGYPP